MNDQDERCKERGGIWLGGKEEHISCIDHGMIGILSRFSAPIFWCGSTDVPRVLPLSAGLRRPRTALLGGLIGIAQSLKKRMRC
jgi:hypothetical protein